MQMAKDAAVDYQCYCWELPNDHSIEFRADNGIYYPMATGCDIMAALLLLKIAEAVDVEY